MEETQQQQLVFIPSPGVGHLVSMVELARLLVHRYSTLSVSLLIITSPATATLTGRYIESLSSNLTPQIQLVNLPNDDSNPASSLLSIIESQKPIVTEAVAASLSGSTSPRLAGFVLDMFCTSMLEVADEFNVPSYIFFTSGAAFLGFMLRIQSLHDDEGFDVTESEEAELVIPSYSNPVPRKVFPSTVLKKDWAAVLYRLARDFRKTKGILVNTVKEVESYAIDSLSRGLINNPNIYTVGPILNLKEDTSSSNSNDVIQWLDEKPESSVVFLCFGSMGAFGEEQVKEIACALEQSGLRFLWSLRRRSEKEAGWASPTDYEDVSEVLPEGFLNRTAEVGKVIGWAPQTAVLAHKAVGGFVSHCGWNSTLESLWFGVPMATWPLYAEQQINAFLAVKELGIGIEIKMDYRVESGDVVKAEEIERGIRSLMDKDCGLKKKVEELRDRIREAFVDGGSSSSSIAQFIQDL
uniref:Glycosyltransferase n=1 Tax=Linum usitatissimum TaxID=4006 RepID=I2BH13_LINUS|nr:UDP-glycosyltransferase 1 [Linum usitatissimum]